MNAKPILLLSVAANVVLAALLFKTTISPKAPEEIAPAAVVPVTKVAAPVQAVPAEAATVAPVMTLDRQFDWRMVESEDYRKYIANLRSIGCPEETIRDIIIADVNKLFESRRKEIVGPAPKFEFWKPGVMMGAAFDAGRMEKERALNQEKRALLTELLGSAPNEKPDLLAGAASQIEAMFDFLPPDKRSKVFDLMQDMQIKMQESMKGGAPDPADMQKAMKETEAAIAAVLSPEEMLDYNLRFSMTANMMRMQLAGFEPTEQEFLDLFQKRKAYDDEYGVAGMSAANLKGEAKERQLAAEKKLNDEIKAQLGEERYQEYTRAQDFAFQAMYRVTERENLGKDAAVKAYAMKQTAEEEARKLRSDTSLTPEQRTAALAGIRAETEKGIRTVFGEKAYESYESQAWWLRSISPDPKPESPTP